MVRVHYLRKKREAGFHDVLFLRCMMDWFIDIVNRLVKSVRHMEGSDFPLRYIGTCFGLMIERWLACPGF